MNKPHLTQMEMFRAAEASAHARMRLFNEIMTGPNPPTPDEIRRMVAMRPVEYGFMAGFLPENKAPVA